ncbi:MAG: hypothetical protein JSV49_01395, partial [Thermoplasmata archaeon]
IKKFYRKNHKKYIKRWTLFTIVGEISILLFIFFTRESIEDYSYLRPFFIINFAIIFFIILGLTYLFADPIILYRNGIKVSEPKFILKILRIREFIHFNKIKKIKGLGKEDTWLRFYIELKNNKTIYQTLDSLEELKLILNTFKNYNINKRRPKRVLKKK